MSPACAPCVATPGAATGSEMGSEQPKTFSACIENGQPTHAAFWTENEQCFTAPSSTLKCVTVLKLSQMSSLLLYSWHCTIILNNSELFHCLCLFFMSTHGSHKSKSELHLSKDIQCIRPLQKGNQIKACKPVKQFVLALVVASDAS